MWGYQPAVGYTATTSLIGYQVEATDGTIGKVDKHSDDVGASHFVFDTGVWIFGRHLLIPAGLVVGIDTAEERIYVDRTKGGSGTLPSSTRTNTPVTLAITSSLVATTKATVRET
jgi:hypothetical protein